MSSDKKTSDKPEKEEVKVSFADLGIAPKILKALDDMGYVHATPIQAGAIPPALQGRDVLGIAQTGTGKTGAFTLPTVHKLSKGRARARMPRCLIICPTRELAAQVAENVELYGKYLKLEMALLIGGVSFGEQDAKLQRGVDVLIATPGRLLDQFDRGKILLNGVQTLIVDEADRMMDMGFIPDIEKIFKMTPFTRQVLFFSATMPDEIKRLVDQFLHQPVTIQVARENKTADTVTQKIVRMPSSDSKQKRTALRWLIENSEVKNGIVFCNRKKDVDIVAKSLTVHGLSAAPIHGDLDQSLRTKTLGQFKSGELKFLVASDVAARGLDIPDVSHVFNYDVPTHSEDYVHRIGRTGRAGRKGDTIMLVSRLDEKYYKGILDLIQVEAIEELVIPDLENFPKEGSRRGKRDDKKRSNSRRRSGSSSNSDRSSSNSDRPSSPAKSAKSDKPDRAPRSDRSDKKAPSKKTDDSRSNDNRSKSKPTSSSSDRKESVKTDTASKDSGKKPDRNRDRNSRSRRSEKPHKDEGVSGFGENMPAFFNTGLK